MREPAPQGWARCNRGDICFFSKADGQGEMCNWYDYDLDWHDEFIPCAWVKDSRPKSAFNNGHIDPEFVVVQLFSEPDYKDPSGCVLDQAKVNFPGDGPLVRSHKWAPTCSGGSARGGSP